LGRSGKYVIKIALVLEAKIGFVRPNTTQDKSENVAPVIEKIGILRRGEGLACCYYQAAQEKYFLRTLIPTFS
jgi:hypothetical protein